MRRLKRDLRESLEFSQKHFPASLVLGARQVGKSTLVETFASGGLRVPVYTLDDRVTLDAALRDPDGFIADKPRPIIIDEVQRAPDLLRAIKYVIDRNRRPGLFLLTGSANVMTLSAVSESLAGRVAVQELLPFSLAERLGKPRPTTLDDLFRARGARDILKRWPHRAPADQAARVKAHILAGGYPVPSLATSHRVRMSWFASYRQTYIERDVREISAIENIPDFNALHSTLSLRTGSLLNFSELSRDIGLPFSTVRRYFSVLHQTYQFFLVPPWHTNLGKRLTKTAKVYAIDTGAACLFTAVPDWATLEAQSRVGAMVETFAASEIRKMIALSDIPTSLSFWRTQTGREVDFLLERGGQVIGIEVKWGTGVSSGDLAGLRSCRAALGKRFRLGVILHSGPELVALDPDTIAVPWSIFCGVA